jgi:hypothetical protein
MRHIFNIFILLLFFLLFINSAAAQEENIPLNSDFHATTVYEFLKDMRVKKITSFFHDDNLPLSRHEVMRLLREADAKQDQLSDTEKKLLRRFQISFDEAYMNDTTFTNLISHLTPFSDRAADVLSDKEKNFFYYKRDSTTVFIEVLLNAITANQLDPKPNTTAYVYDAAFRFRGTLFGHLSYMLYFAQGINPGNQTLARRVRPDLETNFKGSGNLLPNEFPNYTLSEGYVRFYAEPVTDFDIAFQIGREPVRYGFGYGNRLLVSGNGPVMDFIKLNANYGIFHYSQYHFSTVGDFSPNRDERYSKFFAMHKLKISVPNWFSASFGDIMIYSGRGLEIAYLTPIVFYKFVEQSVGQDRDNSLIFVDMQTNFLKNFELQGMFLMDEAINFQFFSPEEAATNKYAFQLGAYWYEAFWLQNFSLAMEYTYIRPYVYSHFNPRNAFTAYGIPVGNPIGANSDELYVRAGYNASDWLRFQVEFRSIRSGRNIVDAQGNLVRNVGSDITLTWLPERDALAAPFLDGERFNTLAFGASVRYEPLKNYILELRYSYQVERDVARNINTPYSFGFLRVSVEY